MAPNIRVALTCALFLAGSVQVGFGETANRSDFHSENHDAVVDVPFEQLEFDPGKEFRRMFIPKEINALDGKRLRLQGYMLPTFQRTGIQRFVLEPNASTRFGAPQREAFEAVRVFVKEGHGVEYSAGKVVVEGTFTIDPMSGKNGYISLYRLDDASMVGTDGTNLTSRIKAPVKE